VKLGIRVSTRTVWRYMPPRTTPRRRSGSQNWSTFVPSVRLVNQRAIDEQTLFWIPFRHVTPPKSLEDAK